jgi:hypothetical protein
MVNWQVGENAKLICVRPGNGRLVLHVRGRWANEEQGRTSVLASSCPLHSIYIYFYYLFIFYFYYFIYFIFIIYIYTYIVKYDSSLSVDYVFPDRLNLSGDSSSEGGESVDNFSGVHLVTFRPKHGSSSGGTNEETFLSTNLWTETVPEKYD